MKDSDTLAVFHCLGIIAVFPVSATLSGFALKTIWGWFVQPVFHCPELTVVQAIGISMVVSYLTYNYQPKQKEPDSFAYVTAIMLARPLMALAFGWAVKSFM